MYNNILVATDLSPRACNALNHAVKLAHLFNSKITLINVHEEFMSTDEMGMLRVSIDSMKELFAKIASEAKKEMKATISMLNAEDIDVEYILKEGKPTTAICEEADKNKIDLIIMGVSEKNTLSNFLFSSTASYVIEHVKIPVLVVPMKNE